MKISAIVLVSLIAVGSAYAQNEVPNSSGETGTATADGKEMTSGAIKKEGRNDKSSKKSKKEHKKGTDTSGGYGKTAPSHNTNDQ